MKTVTKIEKIKKMIKKAESVVDGNTCHGIIKLRIGSALENVAFECALEEHASLNLDRFIYQPLADFAYYAIKIDLY